MRDALAEKLLAKVLGWSDAEVAAERPVLQALAAFKYDEYQQFSAGDRFIESLALWLGQFNTTAERSAAYAFVRSRMVFCSESEMRHLVEMAYPDYVRPTLLRQVAKANGINPDHAGVAARLPDFRLRQRECLFLGLSDGARIDSFRRANPDLNHEQISQTYELSPDRVGKLIEKLAEHLADLGRPTEPGTSPPFKTLVLLDDFSASGTSYYSLSEGGKRGGKINALFDSLVDAKNLASRLVDPQSCEVIVLIYMATQQAIGHLRERLSNPAESRGFRCSVEAVQTLPAELPLRPGVGDEFATLVDRYYDHGVWDKHLAKGGTDDAKYGYAGCGLPLVLHHNTPNNALALLWSYEDMTVRGLFPRVRRHKEME